jgi:hypothetical protein
MPSRVEFIAAYFTLAGNVLPLASGMASPHSLADRAHAAARAGYAGIGLHTDDLVRVVEQHGYEGVRQIIADSGLKYVEIEALLDWFADGERRRASDAARKIMLEGAERLGAYQIKIVGDLLGGNWPVSRLSDEFRTLCLQAADVGTQVAIEALPFSNITDPRVAAAIVAGAGAANGGILARSSVHCSRTRPKIGCCRVTEASMCAALSAACRLSVIKVFMVSRSFPTISGHCRSNTRRSSRCGQRGASSSDGSVYARGSGSST